MRVKIEQLDAALGKKLAPVYLITGDEPLQQGEAADKVRRAARKAGYDNREVLTVDGHFQWHALAETADSFGIFSDKKIIDLRLPSGKPGAEGSKALLDYCSRLSSDTLLLMTCGKLDSSAMKAKWVQALDNAGIIVQVWPLSGADLLGWLQTRMASKGLSCDKEGLHALAGRIEGNLLAAAQEIEKLYVLHGPKHLSRADIDASVSDSSRYDVFNLCDAMLKGKSERVVKVLQVLQSEGVSELLVVWAVAREVRLLLAIKTAAMQGFSKEQTLKNAHIWEPRKSLLLAAEHRLDQTVLDNALVMSAEVDRQIKGLSKGEPWQTLLHLCLSISGITVTAETI